MKYNRSESFRFTFGEPIPATFRLIVGEEEQVTLSNKGECLIHDISPSGMKFFTQFDLPIKQNIIQMEVAFVLYKDELRASGTVKWRQAHQSGFMYGIDLVSNAELEEQIIVDLKAMRKQQFEEERRQL